MDGANDYHTAGTVRGKDVRGWGFMYVVRRLSVGADNVSCNALQRSCSV